MKTVRKFIRMMLDKYVVAEWLYNEADQIEASIDPSWQSHEDIMLLRMRVVYLRERADKVGNG